MTEPAEPAPLGCFEVLARLDAFVAGELGGAELEAVRAHVAGCRNCESFGGYYAKTVEAIRGLPTAAANDGLRRRVLGRFAAP